MPFVDPAVITGITTEVLVLPDDVNPYSWLGQAMKDRILPQLMGPAYHVLLWISVGMHSIALLCHLGTIYLRIRSKQFWLFRRNNEHYIVPNVAVSFASIGLVYCFFAITAHSQLSLYFLPELRNNLILWPTLALLCLTLSAWMEIWSTAVSVIAMDDSPTHTPRIKARLSPRIFNIIFAGFPFVYLCIVPGMAVPLDLAWNDIINSTRQVFQQLENDAANWSSGSVSLAVLQRLAKQLADSEQLYTNIAYEETVVTVYEAILNSVLLLIWCPLLVSTVKQLRRQIKFMKQQTSSVSGSGPHSSSMASDTAYQRKLTNLIDVCRQRILNASVGYAMGLSYVAVCLIPITQGAESLTTRPAIAQAFLLGAALIYTVFGVPTSMVLTYVTYKTCRKPISFANQATSSGSWSSRSVDRSQKSKPTIIIPTGHLQQHIELQEAKGDPKQEDFV